MVLTPKPSLSRAQRRTMQRCAEEAERAIEGDRRFFARFPNRSYRIRPMSAAERKQFEAVHGGPLDVTPECPVAFLAIKQLAPGARIKGTLYGPAHLVGEEPTEAQARAIFEQFADLNPHVRLREADMLRAMRQPGGPLHQAGGQT